MNKIVMTPTDILKSLGLTATEVEIYICMTNGICTAKEIIKYTDLKRPTVYYALNNLEHRGLISKKHNHLDNKYTVSSFEILSSIAEEQRLASENVATQINGLIPVLAGKTPGKDEAPSVAFYEGIETIKHLILSTAYCKKKHIRTIIPKDGFFWNIDPKFIHEYVERRVKNGVKTQSMWEKKIDQSTFTKYYKNISNIRIFPKHMSGKFSTSIFIYDDKVMYISSTKNAYCIIVNSTEHFEIISALFEGLWAQASPHKN